MSLRDFVFDKLNEGIVDIAHNVILSLIKPYSAKDILQFISTDTDPWGEIENPMKSTGALNWVISIFRKYPEQCLKYVTSEQMIIQAQQHRPDLYPIINSLNGRKWLKKRIDDLREFIMYRWQYDPGNGTG